MARGTSKNQPGLTHIDAKGEARMVDVSAKPATERTAIAEGRVIMRKATLDLVVSGDGKKGDRTGTHRGEDTPPRRCDRSADPPHHVISREQSSRRNDYR